MPYKCWPDKVNNYIDNVYRVVSTVSLPRPQDNNQLYIDNSLSGEILEEMTSLVGLQSLNFSHKLLVGSIPDNVGAMGSLECVDLSTNYLSGEIPPSIS